MPVGCLLQAARYRTEGKASFYKVCPAPPDTLKSPQTDMGKRACDRESQRDSEGLIRELMPELGKRLAKDFSDYYLAFYFDSIVLYYMDILGSIWNIFHVEDTELTLKATEAIETFLKEKKTAKWLKEKLKEIWGDYARKTQRTW